MAYAWIIDTDHLNEGDDGYADEAGTIGPRDAPDRLTEQLAAGEGYTFKMWDDDGELYYTGRMVCDADDLDYEESIAGPLDDFGTPNAGAVLIKYLGKPDWTIG